MSSASAPAFQSTGDYGKHLGDVAFWEPYARTALRRSRHAGDELECGFVGTFPTFLAGPVVVKLFGYFPGWRTGHDTELAVYELLAGHPDVPAPRLVASGELYPGEPDPWPYLVSTRIHGQAWRDLSLPTPTATRLAATLGEVVRRVHDLPVPPVPAFRSDWLGEHRAGCVERQLAWGSLPRHLVGQIPEYLTPAVSDRRLVHADLTADHIYVADERLAGVIDWGDAMVTDPSYELGALTVDAFHGDRRLLRTFLDAYGWPVDDGFVRRTMSVALQHQFDLFASVRDVARRPGVRTLDDLARHLWDLS